MYTIDLGNGNVLTDLTLNGTNYVSQEEITEDLFDDMGTVTISNDEDDVIEELSDVTLVYLKQLSDGYYFMLRELTTQEVDAANLEAQVFYTAVSTDTLMEEE